MEFDVQQLRAVVLRTRPQVRSAKTSQSRTTFGRGGGEKVRGVIEIGREIEGQGDRCIDSQVARGIEKDKRDRETEKNRDTEIGKH